MANIAHVDGGRVPGTKATTIGGLICKDGVEVARYSEVGGDGSNTDAEWQSVIRCLELALEHGLTSLHIKTDATVIADMLLSEYDVVNRLIVRLKENPRNHGLHKAVRIRTKQRFDSLRDMANWIGSHREILETTNTYPANLRHRLEALTAQLQVSVELIPRAQNSLADELCRKARRKVAPREATASGTQMLSR